MNLLEKIEQLAKDYAKENLTNPSAADVLMIQNAMLKAASIALSSQFTEE